MDYKVVVASNAKHINAKAAKERAAAAGRLREVMREKGIKQIDLVNATGLNRSTISRYLSGELEPRVESKYKLAEVLDVDPWYIWGYNALKERAPDAKKNDAIVDVVSKLRVDADFLDVVKQLAELPADQYASIKNILAALRQK